MVVSFDINTLVNQMYVVLIILYFGSRIWESETERLVIRVLTSICLVEIKVVMLVLNESSWGTIFSMFLWMVAFLMNAYWLLKRLKK